MASDVFPALLDVLPHRPPFLFLDEVRGLTKKDASFRRAVREDEPQFQGHYPGNPLMPGVLLCEAALQAGAYLMACTFGDTAQGQVPVVTRMNNVKFRRPVRPGDQLDIHVQHLESVMGAQLMRATLSVADKKVASLEFTVTMIQEASP